MMITSRFKLTIKVRDKKLLLMDRMMKHDCHNIEAAQRKRTKASITDNLVQCVE
jgi:hypothetical protein